MLGHCQLSKGGNNKAEGIILTICKTLVQSYLEGCMQFWSLHLKMYRARLERVQRTTIKMIEGCSSCRMRRVFTLDKETAGRVDKIKAWQIVKAMT